MAFNSFIQLFTPKDRVFYSLFEEVADGVAKMGKLMKEVVGEPDFDKRAAIISQVEDQEHVNDDLTHRIFTELGRNFITPFDREDIHYLASSLDDICDYIYATCKKINFYKVNPNDTGIQKMADLIDQGAVQIQIAIRELRNMRDMRKITDALVKVNSIENQADDIFDLSIDRLFETEPDAKEVIKKREIYQVMEIVTDKCEVPQTSSSPLSLNMRDKQLQGFYARYCSPKLHYDFSGSHYYPGPYFDYINGFHDAANSIATIVSTKVLTPFQAVLWAALFNFAAFFISRYIVGEFKIGNTIASSVNKDFINLEVIFSGLIAAICWNLLTWWFGIPLQLLPYPAGGIYGCRPGPCGCLEQAWRRRDQLCQGDTHLPVHFPGALYRDGNCFYHHYPDPEYLPPGQPLPGRQMVQAIAIGVFGPAEPGTWRQRRPESHGDHRRRHDLVCQIPGP